MKHTRHQKRISNDTGKQSWSKGMPVSLQTKCRDSLRGGKGGGTIHTLSHPIPFLRCVRQGLNHPDLTDGKTEVLNNQAICSRSSLSD